MTALLIFVLCLSSATLAQTYLRLVSPAVNQLKTNNPIRVDTELNGNFLKVHFDVQAKEINGKPIFTAKDYPFQFDVVELFLAVGESTYPYYEFEVTPFDQTFVVRIDSPKKFINNVPVEWHHSAELTPYGWTVTMIVDLGKLGWGGDPAKIKGNLYAIQGKVPNRHFWSLSLPKMKKANFHSPQYFQNLIN